MIDVYGLVTHIASEDTVSVKIRRISVIRGLFGPSKTDPFEVIDHADLTDSHGFLTE
jgi:hypothetical protein